MKRLLLFTITVVASCFNTLVAQRDIYLSAQGCDNNSGSKESPLYTLNAAATKARGLEGSDTVFIRIAGGHYSLQSTLILTEADSKPLVFVGEENDKPTFYGGISIKGWVEGENGIWKTTVKESAQYGFMFEQLYIDGKRAVRARTPNKEWFFVTGSRETVLDQGTGRSPAFASQTIIGKPEDMQSLRSLNTQEHEDVVTMFYHKWDVTRKQLNYLNVDSGFMCFSGEGMKSWNAINKGARYTIENYLPALDTPGEWFLSRAGELYYMPYPDQDMHNITCYAPVNKQFIILKGNEKNPVTDKYFRNLSFKVAAYLMPENGNEPMQAAAAIDAAVMADYARNIGFVNCEIAHTGGYGIWLRRSCSNGNIEHCNLHDLGAGGIKVGDLQIHRDNKAVTSHIRIHNNIIQHAGYVFPCGVGVSIFNASDNEVTHNEISDIRYSGVSIGWMWGYSKEGVWTNTRDQKGNVVFELIKEASPAVRNNVSFNHIHHIGWGELSDMGAVYTLGESPGTRVCNNVIHNIYSYDYGGWGLYTDEGSSDILMANNLVYGCKSGGFHQHYGKNNTIKNNIFAFGHYYQLQYTRAEQHRSFNFTNNIVLQDCGILRTGPWATGDVLLDNNCYWDMRTGNMKFEETTLKEWRKARKENPADTHSVVADPLFENPTEGNFRFKSHKTARKIGFIPFDYTKAGVYGQPEWVEKAKLDNLLIQQFEAIILSREKEHSALYH